MPIAPAAHDVGSSALLRDMRIQAEEADEIDEAEMMRALRFVGERKTITPQKEKNIRLESVKAASALQGMQTSLQRDFDSKRVSVEDWCDALEDRPFELGVCCLLGLVGHNSLRLDSRGWLLWGLSQASKVGTSDMLRSGRT